MSEDTIRVLTRKLKNVEELFQDSNYENDRLRRQSYNFYEALEDLRDKYEDLKKKHEKLKERIQEKNLSAELLENLEGLTIAD